MTRIIDISVDLFNGMHVYPGDPLPTFRRTLKLPRDPFNVSNMETGTHVGTHVDPPVHFIMGGYSVDKIPLDHLYGKAEVIDLTHVEKGITADDIKVAKEKILLFKTRNHLLWKKPEFSTDYVYLDESGAKWCVDNGIKTVGIDYLSIGAFEGGEVVHKILLEKGITIVEGLNLENVEPGEYTFICLPIKIRDGDGAPARAILVTDH